MFKVNNKDSVSIALHLHYLRSYYTYISTFTFPFITLGSHSRFYKIICVCLVNFNEFSFLTAQKGNGIAGIGYFKVKNNVTH